MSIARITFVAALLLACGVTARADNVLTRSFSRGDAATDVGIAPGGPDVELEGPDAIYSGDNGEIYVLDQVNSRILKFDPRAPGAPPQEFLLPDGVSPTDLVVSNGKIHVWDGQVLTLEPTGPASSPTRGLTLTRSAEPVDDTINDAFSQMGSRQPGESLESLLEPTRSLTPAGRRQQTVATHGGGAVIAKFSPFDGDAAVRIDVASRRGGHELAKLDLRVTSRLGAVDLLDIDSHGRYYVFAENVPEGPGDTASDFVARYGPNATLEGVYDLPLTRDSGLARRFVTVSPDGEVYFLRTRKGSSNILGVGFRRVAKGEALPYGAAVAPSFSAFDKIGATHALVRPLTRRQVIENGIAFATVRWRVTPTAYGPDPDRRCSGFNRIRRPGYMRGKLNRDVVGIPYCWGCSGSLSKIASLIQHGELAGNVCTRDNPRRDIAGVDCSAFVSAAWGLSTHFTTLAIPSIARPVPNVWDMLPGDVFDKPGSHVMLFMRFTRDRKAEVLESSTGGCNGKVCHNIYPVGSLLARGYRPMRYRALMNADLRSIAPDRE
ncbi:hypothetical protein K9U39_07760 [Rhodoblastus acidophilus]|uniref:NHL repeat containing protein n=1 Tax=Candidatus Rhodoblastus alkanivorans TaxID=2954117 RepID=A0ABS9Z7W1_9HYPH|nr:hypothetical protein [Candidatus Rhodoblastus alkanivorans]MCI4678267.1 hypothetical protein [Candidatus Rhodoblastus alkanivorans]MCI4683525.1 hypothetical protein [Candidatus Rhodoblastus alkanivorans]MDI4640840.1 hypothetical protein [Rhodoblastus acidophilus]